MKKTLHLQCMLYLLCSVCSCTTAEITTSEYPVNYMDLYQTSYENLKLKLSDTRSSDYSQEITVEEIENISTLEKLTSYDFKRLEEIEDSRVYQEKYERALAIEKKTKETFLKTHSEREFSILVENIKSYIKKGTHNDAALQRALQNNIDNQFLQEQITMAFALVDAYGEFETWNNDFEIVSISPCDKQALEQVVLVLAVTAINLSIDGVLPWMAFLNAATTLESICQLITIHNNWIRCKKEAQEIS